MTESPFAYVTICDHIIIDNANKHSLIGIYANDLVIDQFPAVINLALFFKFKPQELGEHAIKVMVLSDNDVVVNGNVVVHYKSPEEHNNVIIPNLMLSLEKPVTLTFKAFYRDVEYTIYTARVRTRG